MLFKKVEIKEVFDVEEYSYLVDNSKKLCSKIIYIIDRGLYQWKKYYGLPVTAKQ
jgi:hypothetical protein